MTTYLMPSLRKCYGASVRVEEDRQTSLGPRWRCWVDREGGPVPVGYGATEDSAARDALLAFSEAQWRMRWGDP